MGAWAYRPMGAWYALQAWAHRATGTIPNPQPAPCLSARLGLPAVNRQAALESDVNPNTTWKVDRVLAIAAWWCLRG